MTRQTRAVILVAAVALAFLAAVNVGGAAPGSPAVGSPTVRQNPNPPQGGGQQGGGQQGGFQQGGGQQGGGQQGGFQQGGGQQGGGQQGGGQQGGFQQGGGQQGGGGVNWNKLADCAPGQLPSPQAPCKFDIQPCAEGQQPSPTAPCRPQGMPGKEGEEGMETGGFDAAPTGAIEKDMKKKFMVINISIEGSGDDEGTFYVTFVKVVSGVKKETKEYLNSQLAEESFVISTSKKTKCFADTKDKDKVPDLVSCNVLSDAADNIAGSVKAQFRGKVAMNESTFEPVFTAQKIVFLKGTYNIAKID